MDLKQTIASSEEALIPSRMARGEEGDRQYSKDGKNRGLGLRTRGKGKKIAPNEKGAGEKVVKFQETHHDGLLL